MRLTSRGGQELPVRSGRWEPVVRRGDPVRAQWVLVDGQLIVKRE